MNNTQKLSVAELKSFYKKDYVERFDQYVNTNRFQYLLKFVRLNKLDKIADFGCGNGLLMKYVSNFVKSYVGVDFSQEFIKLAVTYKKKFKVHNANFFCSDIPVFCNYHKGEFTKAFLLDFIEHIYDDDLVHILTSIKLSLVKNGMLYIHTPNADFFVEKLKAKNFILKQFKEHVAVRTVGQIKNILRRAGFSIIDIKFIPHYNSLKFFHWLSYVPYIGSIFKARIFVIASK